MPIPLAHKRVAVVLKTFWNHRKKKNERKEDGDAAPQDDIIFDQ